ncbi:MAG: alanine racemase [Candidatus Cloacimonetes bacterium]|nr:alanine racemase [Candidatus Cloacimonadota bacterium]
MQMKNNQFRSWTVINLDNYRYNIHQIQKFLKPKVEIMQIVKADAYGHGSAVISDEAEKLGINWFGIANSDEGILLRLEGIESRILILSPSFPSEIEDIFEYNLTPSISTFQFAKELNEFAKIRKKIKKVHINFDTGMGRAGFFWNKTDEVISEFQKLKNIKIEGVFSHFSMSEIEKNDFSQVQNKRFEILLKNLKSKGIQPEIVHISNSAATINFPELQYDMVRLGLMSFGIYTDELLKSKIQLRPVMTFKSKIGLIKEFPADFGISYQKTFVTAKPMRAAILPIGYGDGYNFLLSNIGKVIINGEKCPILGRVTMDMIIVDISNVKNAKVGDEVILLGNEGANSISAEEISRLYKGLSYETVCNFGRRAQRIFVREKKNEMIEPISRRTFIAKDFSDTKLEKIIQTSLNQRLNSKEIGSIIHQKILENLFSTYDKKIGWKTNFVHSIKFFEIKNDIKISEQFFLAKTKLSYHKILTRDNFKIVCANSLKNLEQYFQSENVEYRWLLDNKIDLKNSFKIDKIMVNDILLTCFVKANNTTNFEIECSHPKLKNLLGNEVQFTIDTTTYYPKSKHQLGVYFSELTKGISVAFDFSETEIKNVEAISFIVGKEKFPNSEEKNGKITINSHKKDWVFPNSGIVFVW